MDRFTVPTKYWHRSTTAGSSATSARGPASCATASAACASCAPARATRSCSPPTAARAGSASTRSRRSRSTTSCPARPCSPSAPRAATSPAGSARTGTSPSRRRSTRSPTRRRRRPSRERPPSSAAAAWRSPTTTRRSSWSTPIDVADACHELRHQDGRGHRRLHLPEPRGRVLPRTSTPPTSTSRASPRTSTGTPAAPSSARCSTRSSTWHETDVWVELTTLLIPGLNDSDDELDAMTRWVVEHLGPDVPMHFTAFHPDYRMLDRRPTPPATLTRARRIAMRQRRALRLHGQRPRRRRWQHRSATRAATRVIERDWYELGEYRLDDTGHCRRAAPPFPACSTGPPATGGAAANRSCCIAATDASSA